MKPQATTPTSIESEISAIFISTGLSLLGFLLLIILMM